MGVYSAKENRNGEGMAKYLCNETLRGLTCVWNCIDHTMECRDGKLLPRIRPIQVAQKVTARVNLVFHTETN